MPGSVQNAEASAVMPRVLARHFTARREYLANENSYRNGERQVALQVSTSRKTFELTAALAAEQLAALRAFYDAHVAEPFFFYYGPETSPAYTHDPTGVASSGRYTVVFGSEWSETVGIARSEVPLVLFEVN